MKIVCLGGGPAGLYFAISAKLRNPAHEVVVVERNRADDTFGWGVVLSDETLANLAANDPVSAEAIRAHFAYWDDIAVVHDGVRTVSSGHGFCGIGRKRLLLLLQERARDLGVELRFETEIESAETYRGAYDLVVASDGLNSRTRTLYAEAFQPDIETRRNKFVWLGTAQSFDDAFTFIFERTEHGWVWAHAYQFEPGLATFIVECAPETWAAWGFGEMDQAESIAACERIFAAHLGGHPLMSNARHLRGSAWLNFPRVLCARWSHENVVLLGDAAATAHFSIGSGTRLAMEDAIALVKALKETPRDISKALAAYQEARKPIVQKIVRAANQSADWYEGFAARMDETPWDFADSYIRRAGRIDDERLAKTAPDFMAGLQAYRATTAGAA